MTILLVGLAPGAVGCGGARHSTRSSSTTPIEIPLPAMAEATRKLESAKNSIPAQSPGHAPIRSGLEDLLDALRGSGNDVDWTNPGLQRGWQGLLDKMSRVMNDISEQDSRLEGLNGQLGELTYGMQTLAELVGFLRALPDDGGGFLWLTEQGAKPESGATTETNAARLRDNVRELSGMLGESLGESAAALRDVLSYMVNVNVDPAHWGPKLEGAYDPVVNSSVLAFRVRRARANLAFVYADYALAVEQQSLETTNPGAGQVDTSAPKKDESMLEVIAELGSEQRKFLEWHRDVTKDAVQAPLTSLAFLRGFASLDQMSREDARRAQDLENGVLAMRDGYAAVYRGHLRKIASLAKSAGKQTFRFAP